MLNRLSRSGAPYPGVSPDQGPALCHTLAHHLEPRGLGSCHFAEVGTGAPLSHCTPVRSLPRAASSPGSAFVCGAWLALHLLSGRLALPPFVSRSFLPRGHVVVWPGGAPHAHEVSAEPLGCPGGLLCLWLWPWPWHCLGCSSPTATPAPAPGAWGSWAIPRASLLAPCCLRDYVQASDCHMRPLGCSAMPVLFNFFCLHPQRIDCSPIHATSIFLNNHYVQALF